VQPPAQDPALPLSAAAPVTSPGAPPAAQPDVVMWFQPDGTVTYSAVPPWPAPGIKPKRSYMWVLAPVAVVSILAMVVFGGVVGLAAAPSGRWVSGQGGLGSANPAVGQSPRPGDPGSVRLEYLNLKINEVLGAQAKALLAGDEAGFAAPADQANSELLGKLRGRFITLRAMKVARWEETVDGLPSQRTDGSVQVMVKESYCMGELPCRPASVTIETRWRDDNAKIVMTDYKASTRSQQGPRPWEVTDLAVSVGKYVVVAGPARLAGRVQSAALAADRSAAVANHFAQWSSPPNRFLIYLAGPTEWNTWYSANEPDWAAAFAIPVSDYDAEVVVNAARVTSGDVEDLLRHELTHVTSLAGAQTHGPFWLVEGLADYAMWYGRSVSTYRGLKYVRKFVKTSAWLNSPEVDGPDEEASLDDATGRYGVAFLAVHRLADKYGEKAMMRFFGDVARDGMSTEEASSLELGVDWKTASADIASYIRHI
jgi:hypothetical protein